MATELKVEDFLDYIKQSRSKGTYKEYKAGIKKFSEYYGKAPDKILKERSEDWTSSDLHQKRHFTRELEKFHKWLIEQGYAINSARTLCLGLRQLFRYYEMPLTYLSREVSRTVPTTKDFIPSIAQIRRMFKVADNLRDKLIISMGKDLGWRIGDFAKIKRENLPDLDQEPPILFEQITEKEKIIAKSFLSVETVELLKEYLPTIEHRENPFLYPSKGKGHYDEESINRNLRTLAEEAKVRIPQHKRLRFHAFRKRFLSECANLHIDINTAKVLVGKSVSESMLTYLSDVDHRQAFSRLYGRMRLTEKPITYKVESGDDLRKRVDRLERMINMIAAINPDAVRKADEWLESLNVGTFKADVELEDLTLSEKMALIDDLKARSQSEEYKKLIESNNNNHRNK